MLNELKPVDGARHAKKRVGRGIGSGLGKTAGKGHKGQKARSGGNVRPGFEGGQLPLVQRIPKRGFHNINRVEYITINLYDLNVFEDGSIVTPEELVAKKVIKEVTAGVKVLGQGELEKKLTVKASKFSASAEAAIKALGGTIEVI